MTRTTLPFPGFSSPAVGFEAPFEMLEACHGRVRRSLDLLARIAERVEQDRIDASVRDAARDVLRYFDIAAPLHHEDEERHVFPLVLGACADAALLDAVRALQRDHVAMRDRWAALRGPLLALAADDAAAFDAAARADAVAFIALYERHAALEETLVFPFAAARLDVAALAPIGAEMAARRGAPAPQR